MKKKKRQKYYCPMPGCGWSGYKPKFPYDCPACGHTVKKHVH